MSVQPDGTYQVAARMGETEDSWFVRALGYRFDAYSTALDRLLVKRPRARIVDARLAEWKPTYTAPRPQFLRRGRDGVRQRRPAAIG